MSGRRRFTRYVLLVPADGRARTVSDCVVESWDNESAVVVTNQPARCNDTLALQFHSPSGATALYPVRVTSCDMDPRHGPMRFRLRVQMVAETSPGAEGRPQRLAYTRTQAGSDER
jgi:hypothetical protein